VSWETYYPEAARFGGTAVMGTAEAFFAADSAAAVAQLTAAAGKGGPDAKALTAASMADIAAAATGDDAEAMRWLTRHARADSTPPKRAIYDQAVALVCERPDTAGANRQHHESVAGTPARRLPPTALRWRRPGTSALRACCRTCCTCTTLGSQVPTPAAERACLHLARVAALSWLARARNRAS